MLVLGELAEIRRAGTAYCVGEYFRGFASIVCPMGIRSIGVIRAVCRLHEMNSMEPNAIDRESTG